MCNKQIVSIYPTTVITRSPYSFGETLQTIVLYRVVYHSIVFFYLGSGILL